MRQFDIVTFDCYGTLVDWEGGIYGAFAAAAAEDAVVLDRDAVLQCYAEIEPEVEAERFRSYREVLRETACRVGARLGWNIDPSRAEFLPSSLPDWPAFTDTGPGLERLAAAGHRLGILSNVDDALIAETLKRFPVDFELLITAEQVRSYKPEHGHFLAARERIGDARWLHAAQSHFHDVVPAKALGVPVAWINRKAEPLPGPERPDRELPDVAGLADWLAGQRRGG